MDLSTAIYKCTALPASRIGLKDRGQLLPGYAADITVFNPETIADLATYARYGIRNVTSFAVYMDADYFHRFPSTEPVEEYGSLLRSF